MQGEPKGITKSMSRLSTQPTGPRRGNLTHLNSSGNSSNNSSKDESNGLSRESSTEYTDSTGIDLHEFIITTLKTKDRHFLLSIETELLKLVHDHSRKSYTFSPMNTYERMLVHRVAAYFGFDHNLDQQNSCVCVSKTSSTRIPDLKFSHVKEHDENAPPEPKHYSTLEPKKVLKRTDEKSQSFDKSPDRRPQNGKYEKYPRSKSYEERQKQYESVRGRIFAKDGEEGVSGPPPPPGSKAVNELPRPQVGSGDGPRVLPKPAISVSDSDDTEAATADSSLKQSSHESVDSGTVVKSQEGQVEHWPPLSHQAESPTHSQKSSVESPPKQQSPAFNDASKMSKDKSKGVSNRENTFENVSETNNNSSGSNAKQSVICHRQQPSQSGRQIKSNCNSERIMTVTATKKSLPKQETAIDEPEGQADGPLDSAASPPNQPSPSPSATPTAIISSTSTGATTTPVAPVAVAVNSTASCNSNPSSSSTTQPPPPSSLVQSKQIANCTPRTYTSSHSQQSNRWHQSHANTFAGQNYQYPSHYNPTHHHHHHHHQNQSHQQQQQQQQQQYQPSGNLQAAGGEYVSNSSYYNGRKGHHRKSQPAHSPIHANTAIFVGQQGPAANFHQAPQNATQMPPQAAQPATTALPLPQPQTMPQVIWPIVHDPSRQLTTPVLYNPYAVPPNDFTTVDASGLPVTFLPSTINAQQAKDAAASMASQLPPATAHQTIIMQPSATIAADPSMISNGLYMAPGTQETTRNGPPAMATVPVSEPPTVDSRTPQLASYTVPGNPIQNAQSSVPLNCLPTAGSSTSTLQPAQSPTGQNLYYINPLQAMQMMPATGPFVLVSPRQNQMVTSQGFQVATNQGLLPLPPAYSPYIAPAGQLPQYAHYQSMQVGQPMTVSQVAVTGTRPSPPPPTASIPTNNLAPQQQQPGQGQAVSYFTTPQYTPQYYPFRSPFIVSSGGPNNSNIGTNPHAYSHRRPNNRSGNGSGGPAERGT